MSYRRYRYRRRGYYRRYHNQSPIEGLVFLFFEALFSIAKLLVILGRNLLQKKIQRDSFTIIEHKPATSMQAVLDNTRQTETNVGYRYNLKESLLTPAEQSFSAVLEQVVGDRYRIERQVQLSRIVAPKDSNGHYTNYRDFNRISAKSIDFVLYSRDFKPYLCIELDDSSHLRWDRLKRDAFVDDLMRSVGLKIVHIRRRPHYDPEELREFIFPKQ